MYPVLLALASAVLFGASTPVGKVLLRSLPPFQLAGWLYLGAALGVLPGMVLARRPVGFGGVGDRRSLGRLAGAFFFGGIAGPVLLLMGLQRSSAASVALWLNLELVATAILGWLLFRDHLGRGGWLGVGGTVLASALLSWQEGGVGLAALLLVGAACICWGLDNHLTALIDGITPQQTTFWKGVAAGGVNLAIGLKLEPVTAGVGTVAAGVVVGALAYGVSITLYIRSAQQLGATRSQMIFSSAPFFGVVLAAIFLGERIGGLQLLAALLLIFSLVVLFRDRHLHSHLHDAVRHGHEHRHGDAHHDHDHPGDAAGGNHAHSHDHRPERHAHPHWPDIHHRHKH